MHNVQWSLDANSTILWTSVDHQSINVFISLFFCYVFVFSSINRNGSRKYARAVSNELTWYCQYLMVKCWKRRSHHQIFNFMKFEYLFSIVFFLYFYFVSQKNTRWPIEIHFIFEFMEWIKLFVHLTQFFDDFLS